MKRTVLFVCPHGAAKSILAAAEFQRCVEQQGLPFMSACAGTEPDATLSPAVVTWLRAAGLPIPNGPRQVTPEEMSAALRVVALGCDLRQQVPPHKLVDWAEVPALSVDFEAGQAAIQARVAALVRDLAALPTSG
jgi:arsenate reductase (thioredoxin)